MRNTAREREKRGRGGRRKNEGEQERGAREQKRKKVGERIGEKERFSGKFSEV